MSSARWMAMALVLAAHGMAHAQADTRQAREVNAEVNGKLARLDAVAFSARRPDVAYTSEVRAWADAGGVRKLEVTDRDDSGDVVTEYYYAGGALVFAYQAVKGFNAAGRQATRLEERQYFRDGRMFQWLSGKDKVANPPAGAEFAKESKSRLAASAFYVRAADEAFAGRNKSPFGVVKRLDNGDVSCVLTLEDDQGREFTEPGDFGICFQKPSILGKRVALTYAMAKVLAAECQGDVGCGKSERVALVTKARIVEARTDSKAAASPPSGQASFCAPQEEIVFACRTGAKLVSICASRDASATRGYVQYRFGKPDSREPLELLLPEDRPVPSKAVTGESVPFAGGGGAWMRFRKGAFAYVAYTGIGKWGPNGQTREKAGVAVEQAGRMVANLKCSGRPASLLGPDWFEKAGVQGRGEEFDFPD